MEQRLEHGATDLRLLNEHSNRLHKLEEVQQQRQQQVHESVRALVPAELDRIQHDWEVQTAEVLARARRKAERLDALVTQHCPDASTSDALPLSELAKTLVDAREPREGSKSAGGWVSTDSFSAWQIDLLTEEGLVESNTDGTRQLRLVDSVDEVPQ